MPPSGFAVRAGVDAAAVRIETVTEAHPGLVVHRKNGARLVLHHLEARLLDLVQVLHGSSVRSDWKIGSPIRHEIEGKAALEGTVVEIDPPHKLVTTFAARWAHSDDSVQDKPSRVTWLIEKRGEACKLTLIHNEFEGETATYKGVGPGWNPVLSGLKTLLETGKALVIGPSATS